jgi:hypothetical protein
MYIYIYRNISIFIIYETIQANAARKKSYKKGVDQDDSRRRRTETTLQIRKEKKDDQIQKRRGVSINTCIYVYSLVYICVIHVHKVYVHICITN